MNVFEMKPDSREQAYRQLRDELTQNYSVHVGPSARRNAAHQIAKQRGAGGHHAQAADAQERRLENDVADYEQCVHEKHILAILTGRYDNGLQDLSNPDRKWSNTFPQRNVDIIRAAEMRIDELKSE